MSDFKKLVYEKVVTVLNMNTQGLIFAGGYLLAWHKGVPYHIDQSSLSQFDFTREEIIPVSEEFNQETPSVHAADRSDYIAQYQIMFRLSATTTQDKVQTALEEYRTYMFTNKQHIIDGYNVSFKVTRGDKQPNFTIEGGSFYGYYKLTVYFTAIKNGYMWKDTDTIKVKLSTDTVYEQLKLDTETMAAIGNTTPSDKTGVIKGLIANTAANPTIRFFYNATDKEKLIFAWAMNKGNKDQLWDIKYTFNAVEYDYEVLIASASRTRTDNGVIIVEFSWIEADI